jgi:SAM-dependent methyltransferase
MRKHYISGGPAVELYDTRQMGTGVIRGDVEFYRRLARRTGGPILELGCGTGRVALPLARDGHEVVGLDLSMPMLRIARSKIEPGLRIRFVRGDMARFRLRRKFRLILIPFRAFQHLLTEREQRSCLRRVRSHLAPGGRFILHLFDPLLEYCLPEPHPSRADRSRTRNPATGRDVEIRIRNRRNDPFAQRFSEEWIFIERDARGRARRVDRDVLSLRWTYRWEMRYLLELTGFRIEACTGDFFGGAPRYGSEQIWIATPV